MRSERAVIRGKYAQLFLGTVLAGGFAAPVFAQDTPAPEHVAIDANGVDLINGRHYFNSTEPDPKLS
ncbi:hypothetical protein D3C87_2164050 [compost metagenome]